MCNSDGAAELLLWRVEGLVNLMGWWVVGEVQSFEENLVHRKQNKSFLEAWDINKYK